jgi:hypothetical protein
MDVSWLSPAIIYPPQYLHLLWRFNHYSIHYKPTFAFSIFLIPLRHCLSLRRFYCFDGSIQTLLGLPCSTLRTTDNLAPVTTPKEFERRTLSSRTTYLHLLTFVHSVCPDCSSGYYRFRCSTVTMLKTVHLCCAYYPFLSLHHLRLVALTLPHGSVLIPFGGGFITAGFVQINYSKCTPQVETIGRTIGKVIDYICVTCL